LLPPETERVWNFVKRQPALTGFVLVGGSALAIRIAHRRSEDLDLAYPQNQLPRVRLEAFLRVASEGGLNFVRNDDPAALDEFIQGGLELHDFQQNFLVNGEVKVTFFSPDNALGKVMAAPPEPTVRVASLGELFRAKCLVSALRSKTRDWIDLYVLMREHGFTIQDFASAFNEAGAELQRDIALSRLCSGVPQRDDEGYTQPLKNPPSLEQIRTFFIEQRNRLEISSAAEAMRHRGRVGGDPRA
jgi:hypothetical protein